MSDYLAPVPKEVESQEKFLRVLGKIPKSGIAYRGDQNVFAKNYERDGLRDDPAYSANYIVVIPPTEIPKKYEDTKGIRDSLQDGIRWALSYADPWYSPSCPIREEDFIDYYKYYQSHPDEVYTLSWFTSPTEDHFKKVMEVGSTWYGPNSEHKVGDARRNGAIPQQNVCTPIVATLEDVKYAQDTVVQAMLAGKIPEYELRYLRAYEFELKHKTLMRIKKIGRIALEKDLQKPFSGFDPQYQQTLVTDYLRDSGRWKFHNVLSDKMMEKLFDAIDTKF